MSYPETKAAWWVLVEEHKDELLDLVSMFHPYYRQTYNYPITATMAEKVCEAVRKEIADKEQYDPQRLFERYCKEKNPELVHLLNEVWFGIPESSEVRNQPGFYELCDLCSEGYVLDEEEGI